MPNAERAAVAREVLTLNCERTEVLICALDEYAAACGEHVGSIAREHGRRGRSDTVALWGRRAVVVGDLLADLRTASELSDLAPEATGQDVAGNGHVASADEAAGSFREAPTAPVSSSPPPIPLGAVVEVEGDEDAPYRRVEGGWATHDGKGVTFFDDGWAVLISALYHARREAGEHKRAADHWQEDAKRYAANAEWWRNRDAQTMRERDEARRALAERKSASELVQLCVNCLHEHSDHAADGCDIGQCDCPQFYATHGEYLAAANQANAAGLGQRDPNSEEGAAKSGASPAPASAPRRWWVALAMDGTPLAVLSHVPTPEEWQPMWQRVVPVLEARVTREMVDRVEGIVRTARGTNRTSEHWAYEIVRALGLTVEE